MTFEVRGSTRPGILLDAFGEASANRISLHIAQRDGQMICVQSAGVEAILPQMSSAPAAGIEVHRVICHEFYEAQLQGDQQYPGQLPNGHDSASSNKRGFLDRSGERRSEADRDKLPDRSW